MTQYIYPQNLRAKANLWLWNLRDFLFVILYSLFSKRGAENSMAYRVVL